MRKKAREFKSIERSVYAFNPIVPFKKFGGSSHQRDTVNTAIPRQTQQDYGKHSEASVNIARLGKHNETTVNTARLR